MATANWQSEQPTNLNYLSPVNFDLQINKLPKTRYFCVGATLPSIALSESEQATTLAIAAYTPGDKLSFDPLGVRFIVDEDMTNYQEIYNWMIQLGPGYDTDDYKGLVGSTISTTGFNTRGGDFTKMYSDATLIVNTSAGNANIEFTFEDCFPTSLGAVDFKSDESDIPYVVADLTLRYTLFKIRTTS